MRLLLKTSPLINGRGLYVPANSQIFGHLVFLAGIDGIIYPSKLTTKDCLVCFPRNFANSASVVEIDDPTPDARVPRKLDSGSWKLSEMSFDEIAKSVIPKSIVE